MNNCGFDDLNFAKLDTDRKSRTGFSEVVFCEGKEDDFLKEIFLRLYEKNGEVMGTRASVHQAEIVKNAFEEKFTYSERDNRHSEAEHRVILNECEESVNKRCFADAQHDGNKLPLHDGKFNVQHDGASVHYDEVSKIISVKNQENLAKSKNLIGNIAVCTAGTADIRVAEEAAQTIEFFGSKANRIYDVGVSGIHRLLSKIDSLNEANCVVAIAGMEGALASVLGGLVSVPVIAVPTSVGYGASFGGFSALLTMINSCANGISVVNIDNGYGAGYIATQINRLAENGNVK